jgi:oxygen-dependent protoporphyrinogen oxidase
MTVPTDNRRDVIVVGAGITGLSAAWELSRAGRDVVVVDREDEVGGVMKSRAVPRVGVIDLGPQTVRSRDADLFRHFEELGIEQDRLVAGANGKSRYIVWDGELVELPHSPPSLVGSTILTRRGKLRLLAEPFRGVHPEEDESVRKFFKRRLGKEVAERLVDPFVSGVYAGDPRQLSMRAVFPDLKEGVDASGSILRWGVSRMRASRGGERRAAELFSFRAGIAHWPKKIAARLGADRIWTGHKILAARPDEGGWVLRLKVDGEVRKVMCRTLVLTIPASQAAKVLKDARRSATHALKDIPYAPVSTVHLAYRRESVTHPLDGFGFLVPSAEERKVLGVLWISSLFPERVADGRVLLTTFVGGARDPERAFAPEGRLIDIAYREHRRFLGASTPPVFAHVERWKKAIPQYEFGHLDRVAAAAQLEEENPGLYLSGAYRDGVSVTDCWKAGRSVAERVLQASASDASVDAPEPETESAVVA